eukprot:CAMPEP_0198265296 /NCGR_PEP_ID=MMETSP1447-20131203/21636_1 /TAXON_ID=420782 /ORGANISM="Chaetoceros dichaeta, Strain CCMP1751" /LENGTH=222 /DNA_ID=CAMNT_0043954703 /DNA_START=10 /DNA_END=678 /DNA_ORIENTATION=-
MTSTKNVTKEASYWNNFYAKWQIDVPSQFCVLTATEVKQETTIVEFGCGNGRDSIYLSKQGFRVYACDLSKEAISKNTEKISGIPDAPLFSICDCTNVADVDQLIQKARSSSGAADEGGNITIYNRFFIHSITESQQEIFLTALGNSLVSGDGLLMEFRCSLDEALPKVTGTDHYRRYIETKDLLVLLDSLGFDIEYEYTGQGMAKYKDEDAFVSRIIAKRR